MIACDFDFSIHHSDNSPSSSYLVSGFSFPLRPLPRTRAERIWFLHILRRPSTYLEELLLCTVRQPTLNFDFLQHPQASLQLPLRIVFPTSNCKIRKGKKRKSQGENQKKKADDLSLGTNSEADLSDLNLLYRCQVIVSPVFNNLRDTSSSLPTDTRSPAQARVIRPLLRSAGKCRFRV